MRFQHIARLSLASSALFPVLQSCGPMTKPSAAPSGSAPAMAGVGARLTLTKLQARRAGSLLHLTLVLEAENPGTSPVHPGALSLRLLCGTAEVPRFHAPGLDPQLLAPGNSSLTLHFALSPDHLKKELDLEYHGGHLMVRDASPFAMESLPEDRTAPLNFPHWEVNKSH